MLIINCSKPLVPRSYPPGGNATAMSSTSIYISWKPLPLFNRNGIITFYRIRYNSTLRDDSGIIQTNSSVTSVTLLNLIPYTMYNITLEAATVIGFGPKSASLRAITHQGGRIHLVVSVMQTVSELQFTLLDIYLILPRYQLEMISFCNMSCIIFNYY